VVTVFRELRIPGNGRAGPRWVERLLPGLPRRRRMKSTAAGPGHAPRPVRLKDLPATLYGIRHHGPGSARPVRAALAEQRPDVVLIEGPPKADRLVALAADEQMRPPVALLGYVLGQPQQAAFWPFAVFSPEWQAIRYALDAGVPVRFCDLPASHQLAIPRAVPRRPGSGRRGLGRGVPGRQRPAARPRRQAARPGGRLAGRAERGCLRRRAARAAADVRRVRATGTAGDRAAGRPARRHRPRACHRRFGRR